MHDSVRILAAADTCLPVAEPHLCVRRGQGRPATHGGRRCAWPLPSPAAPKHRAGCAAQAPPRNRGPSARWAWRCRASDGRTAPAAGRAGRARAAPWPAASIGGRARSRAAVRTARAVCCDAGTHAPADHELVVKVKELLLPRPRRHEGVAQLRAVRHYGKGQLVQDRRHAVQVPANAIARARTSPGYACGQSVACQARRRANRQPAADPAACEPHLTSSARGAARSDAPARTWRISSVGWHGSARTTTSCGPPRGHDERA